MVVSISHIVCDLTTLQVLLQEVESVYNGVCLNPVQRSFMDTTAWSNVPSPSDLGFWSKYLDNEHEHSFGTKSVLNRKSYGGSSRMCKIPVSAYHRLVNFSETRKFTLHQLALAAVALTLTNDSENTDVVLGGPFFNFVPYDYGPFDQAVYAGLDELARRNLASVQSTGRYRLYGLSQAGQEEGRRILENSITRRAVIIKMAIEITSFDRFLGIICIET